MSRSGDRRSLHVLAVEPYYGGSHRRFLDELCRQSRHQWTLVTGKAVHWKWRMRSAPLVLAASALEAIAEKDPPDVVFCTDMLDLPQWRGFLNNSPLAATPAAIYFHENQWTYPVSPDARVDFHFGYTNLLSALAAEECWFNSCFHREDFLSACDGFVRRMPDCRNAHDLSRLQRNCLVLRPGFSPPDPIPQRSSHPKLTIGWVSRWEHDKRPDVLQELLLQLEFKDVDFELILLGPRGPNDSESLRRIQTRYSGRISYDGFAETPQAYWAQLARMDVVVSTADHEFFGIAICEAIWAGAIPVLPNRLSYPELAPRECLYNNLQEAVAMIEKFDAVDVRDRIRGISRDMIKRMKMEHTVEQIDNALNALLHRFNEVQKPLPRPTLPKEGDD